MQLHEPLFCSPLPASSLPRKALPASSYLKLSKGFRDLKLEHEISRRLGYIDKSWFIFASRHLVHVLQKYLQIEKAYVSIFNGRIKT